MVFRETHQRWIVLLGLCTSLGTWPAGLAAADRPPAVGDTAADFTAKTPAGAEVRLSKAAAEGPVVLVFLRGYPGYQCPLCSLQVAELLRSSGEFASKSARVILVYPGPAEALEQRAGEFLAKKQLPEHFSLVVDPDYAVTNAYHLRWDAPKETAYPSTFVIDQKNKIRFALVSKSHGGRAKTGDVLAALAGP